MSLLNVNKIAPQSGTDFTLGDSGDTFTVPSGATLTVAGTFTQTGTQTFDGGVDIDNFNINGTTIALSSGDMTLDVAGDIILNADGGDIKFADASVDLLSITNSSSDVVLKPLTDAKDIIFQQFDGTEVARIEDNATFNVVTGKLAINGTAITSTAAELNLLDGVSGLVQADLTKLAAVDATAAEINLIDGGTSRGTTAVADGDGVLINDAGTMRQTTVETLATYIGAEVGGPIKVHAITGDNDAAVVFNSTYITSAYKRYTLEAYNIQCGTDDAYLEIHFSVDNGSNYLSSGVTRINISNTSGQSNDQIKSRNTSNQGSLQVGGGVNFGSGTGEVGANTFELVNFSDTGHYKLMYYNGALYNSGGTGGINLGAAVINTTSAINNIKIKMNSGVIYGEFVLYGIA